MLSCATSGQVFEILREQFSPLITFLTFLFFAQAAATWIIATVVVRAASLKPSKPAPRPNEPIEPHYHEAKYVDDELVRECNKCGRDLMHESHFIQPAPRPHEEQP